MKIIGVQAQKGTYEGRAYDNLKFHCMTDLAKTPDNYGTGVFSFSVSRNKLLNLLTVVKSLDELVGMDITVYYNQYKKVEKVEPL